MENFFDQNLLKTEYLSKLRDHYEDCQQNGFRINPFRNYYCLLEDLQDIARYRLDHARSFVKRIKGQHRDWKSCEAVVTEVLVYHFYLGLQRESLVQGLDIQTDDYDLRIDRIDGSRMYFEIFCVMPNLAEPEAGSFVMNNIMTHTQHAASSIRQKLKRKISKQHQLVTPRENYAVIELNDSAIAGDFAVPSSLSCGYKIRLNKETLEKMGEGYDWSSSLFDEPGTESIKGIIYFSLGDYGRRKYIFNPRFQSGT